MTPTAENMIVAPFPQPGQIVCVRTRTYLVESVDPSPVSPNDITVRLACLDDDAQGDILEVVWGQKKTVLGMNGMKMVTLKRVSIPMGN